MTKEEYLKELKENSDFAPGWDAIDEEFDRLYPGQEPHHLATDITKRAMFGGNQFLDGYSLYNNPDGYYHLVTYGMSELYGDEESYGGDYSGWGYEMTMKLKAENPDDCMWAVNVFANLSRYTYQSKRYYDPEQCVPGNGMPLKPESDSLITALITVEDTTAQGKDTVHGRLNFIQFVGITESELTAIREDISNIGKLIELMKKDNPLLITDLDRKKSYL